jgi:hypothetical protein
MIETSDSTVSRIDAPRRFFTAGIESALPNIQKALAMFDQVKAVQTVQPCVSAGDGILNAKIWLNS